MYVRYVLVQHVLYCTVQEHNERTSTEFNLITAWSTAQLAPLKMVVNMDRNM